MRAMLASQQRALFVAGALFAVIYPGAAAADCGQPGLAAPIVTEFSLRVATSYLNTTPADADDATKKAIADAEITRAQGAFMDVLTSTAADTIASSVVTGPDFEAAVVTAREIAQHMHEAARTDQQVGASASVSGSTRAATETGIPRILSLAVENGTVQRENSGTSATFSSSPYALLLLGKEDSDTTFNDYSHLRRLGLAATLDLDRSNSEGSGDFRSEQLSAVTTSIRLYGDRSTRTTAFVTQWNERVAPSLTQHAVASHERNVQILRGNRQLLQVFVTGFAPGPTNEGEFRKAVREALLSKTTQGEAADAVDKAMQAKLCTLVVEPIRSGAIDLSAAQNESVAAAVRAIQTLSNSDVELQKLLDELNSRPVVTFQHTWNRSDEGSDYSNLVLAADGQFTSVPFSAVALPLAPWSVLLNASMGLNHDPEDNMDDQDTIREVGISGSLEKSMENPVRIGNAAEGVTRISASLTGRYARQLDADADIGVLHGRVAIPLVRGFSLVVALNYATRSETDSKDEVRLAGGLEFNGDTFAELADLQALFEQRR